MDALSSLYCVNVFSTLCSKKRGLCMKSCYLAVNNRASLKVCQNRYIRQTTVADPVLAIAKQVEAQDVQIS